MSIQEQSIQHDIPGQKSSSSMVVNRGNQLYDPHAPPDDDDDGDDVKTHENEQSNDSKYQTTQDSIRINNGKSAHPVINNKDKPQSSEFNEQHQQSSRHRNSPDYHSKSSDRRSRSPHRKRFRLSPTVTNETISSSKTKSSHRNDDRKSSTSSSSTNHKKSSENKDDHHSYRSKSSRNSHSDHRTNLSSLPSSNKSNAFNHTNNGSQRTRSNLIEIVTTESTSLPNRSEPATKSNSKKADDMLMEEMLLEEERKQNPIKPIDLDSLTIPESSNKSTISTKQSTNSTPSPTKKPYYVLHKVPHTNHTTPPRPKKPQIQQPTVDEASSRASLDDRISTIFGVPTNSSTKPPDTQPTISSVQTLTPSDKSTESPQDIKSSLLIIKKKERNSTEKISLPDDKRSNKHYTTEWLASQKPEEAPVTEEIPTSVSLPNLTSNQTTTNPKSSSNGTTMLGKLTELMEKITQKQSDNTSNPTETDEAVPMSAKHLERIERKKQREKRQSEIAAIAKEALKPAFRKNTISKDEYKQIMKKVVTKATSANEIDRVRIGKMIDAYVEKYRLIHEHHNSKDRT